MRIGSNTKFIELERDDGDDASFPLSAEVECDGFTAALGGIWIAQADFETFKLELRKLESTRRGGAKFSDLGHEFALEILVADHAGHLLVSGHVQKDVRILQRDYRQRLEFQFELDTEKLLEAVKDFERL